jgi:hypothetical protein
MNELDRLADAGTLAVKQLRLIKLAQGTPFMINSNDLHYSQCYLEFPDGRIFLSQLTKSKQDFEQLRELTKRECTELRRKYGLKEGLRLWV